jgi:phage FluMu protein Com
MSILKCNFCGKLFKKIIKKYCYEISCPKCREIDIIYIGEEGGKV